MHVHRSYNLNHGIHKANRKFISFCLFVWELYFAACIKSIYSPWLKYLLLLLFCVCPMFVCIRHHLTNSWIVYGLHVFWILKKRIYCIHINVTSWSLEGYLLYFRYTIALILECFKAYIFECIYASNILWILLTSIQCSGHYVYNASLLSIPYWYDLLITNQFELPFYQQRYVVIYLSYAPIDPFTQKNDHLVLKVILHYKLMINKNHLGKKIDLFVLATFSFDLLHFWSPSLILQEYSPIYFELMKTVK